MFIHVLKIRQEGRLRLIEAKSSCQIPHNNFSFPKQEKTCPECNSTKLVKDIYRGEITCGECGLVIEDNIVDTTPRGLSGSKDGEPNRSQTSILQHDRGLATTIGKENRDANGRDIPASKLSDLHRLRKWDRRFRTSNAKDRHLSFAFIELTKLGPQFDLSPDIVKSAALLYRKALEKNLVLGRSIECVARACIYLACRQAKFPKCLDELILSSDYLDKRDVSKAYRLIARELGLAIPLMGPSDYLPKISANLDLPFNVAQTARGILKKAISSGLSTGRNPMSICAGVIYIACRIEKYQIKQKDIAEASNVTDMTLRARYQEIIEKLGIII